MHVRALADNRSMKLAVIGDIHGFWDKCDTAYFNGSDYDALLFVGDFARWTNSLPMARMLAGLTRPAWAIPGNHDAVTRLQLYAAIKHRPLLGAIAGIGMGWRVQRLTETLGPVKLRGFSLDRLGTDLALLTARPHAMGPDRFYYRNYLKHRFGVGDFQASGERLKALVDQAPKRLIILAHNGPAGLGSTSDALFGSDFNPAYGDFGDPDLRVAVDYARASGRRVLAVVAGHMHHRNRKTGSSRITWVHDGQTLYLNAAYVPRMRRDGSHHHHIALHINGTALTAEALFVSREGEVEAREALGPAG